MTPFLVIASLLSLVIASLLSLVIASLLSLVIASRRRGNLGGEYPYTFML